LNRKKSDNYYDVHWENFKDVDIPDVKLKKAQLFFDPIAKMLQPGMKVLDIGCGNGVHWRYLQQVFGGDGQYCGIDSSTEAIAHLNAPEKSPTSRFSVQDACDLQFSDSEFDVVFAYGVLGYTDEPALAFREMVRVCSKGGLIGVFSPEITGVNKLVLDITRSIAAVSCDRGKRTLADVLVPFYGLASSGTRISLLNSSWSQVREVILTNIAPEKLEIIKHQLFIEWVDELGLEIVFNDQRSPTFIWLRK